MKDDDRKPTTTDAELPGRGGGADDGHAFGLENGVQAG